MPTFSPISAAVSGFCFRRAHYGFGMAVLAVDPKPLPKPDFVAALHSTDWLLEMASRVDVLMCAAPHTPVSEGMLNESVFRALKKSAYFINMSRGKVVDTPSPVRAPAWTWPIRNRCRPTTSYGPLRT